MKTPIVFIIFKRPETTKKVFAAIRQAKPKKLFIIADGPRSDRAGEEESCAETRAIIDSVNWDCQVIKNYADANMGCARRVSSGLDWVFEQVEEAIILEDDCIPDSTFFRFCEDLLEKYRHDVRVMSITGQNVQFGRQRTDYSYYFSRYSHCWGWATWKRAWQYFDFNMTLWPEVKQAKTLNQIFETSLAAERWIDLLERTYNGQINSWAYRWSLCCFLQSGLHIIPNRNLVSNIGFAFESTNTHMRRSKLSNIPSVSIGFPLKEPPYVVRHAEADQFTQNAVYAPCGKKAIMQAYTRRIVNSLHESFAH